MIVEDPSDCISLQVIRIWNLLNYLRVYAIIVYGICN